MTLVQKVYLKTSNEIRIGKGYCLVRVLSASKRRICYPRNWNNDNSEEQNSLFTIPSLLPYFETINISINAIKFANRRILLHHGSTNCYLSCELIYASFSGAKVLGTANLDSIGEKREEKNGKKGRDAFVTSCGLNGAIAGQ